jgi:hypothetical protein
MQEGLKDLSMQERSISTQEVLREGILTSDPLRAHQQCEVTTLGEDKNKNGKRIQKQLERLRSQERRQGSSVKRKLSWKSYRKLQRPDGRLHRLEPRRRQVRRI